MILFPTKTSPSDNDYLYQLILNYSLDCFIAIDEHSRILDWSKQTEKTFGWTKNEVLGRALTETIIPVRYRDAHMAGMKRFLESGTETILNRRIEIHACKQDGTEIPIELTVTPIKVGEKLIFSASLRDISQQKKLQTAIHHQTNITRSILDSMANGVVVADMSQRLIMANPAAMAMLDILLAELEQHDTFRCFTPLMEDRTTPYPEDERPIIRALAGENVDGMVAYIRNKSAMGYAWVSVNARPLLDEHNAPIGAVAVFHDITALREREEALEQQTRMLREQASLLDLAHDAILVRNASDVITYWNSSAEKLYKYNREEAIGQNSNVLLATRFPIPREELQAIMLEQHFWEGKLIHVTKDGEEITVFSQWSLELEGGHPLRYLETNSDITQRVKTERALQQSQENYRMLVEASTDYAIMMMDADGTILSWNSGAEKIIGLSEQEAIGRPVSAIFTSEDKTYGEPLRELNDARLNGRSEDDRWHMKKDGTRFWATGVVTPLWNKDGSLRGYVKIMRDQTEQRLMEEQTRFLASHDVLTGLSNRVNFSNQLHQSIALSDRNRIPFAILLVDLDQFKYVNDTFGHHTGDLLLKEVAMRILSVIRETDFVARLGGDEFVVIQSDVRQPVAAETLAAKIVRELGQVYSLEGNEVNSGASIGISIYPRDAKNSLELVKCADLALYQAKNAGRHTHRVYTPDLFMQQAWKKDQERELRLALENHEFELYYQPQIDLSNWTVASVEVLLRWHAAGRELMLPKDFLDAAEKSGAIVEIGHWALLQACRQSMEWQNKGMPGFRVSFNCSARQFNEQKFVGMIRYILSDTGIAPERLELEISDATFAHQPEIKAQLAELRELGVRIVLDNFGTGTTTFADLKDFPVDALKIDKALVQHLPHRREDSAITSTIINLAHNLDIDVTAGGVETAEQLAYLIARDCTCAQGFIFSPPVPAKELKELLVYGHWSRINSSQPSHTANTLKNLH